MPVLKVATCCGQQRLAVQLKERSSRTAHRAGASAPSGHALQRRAPQLARRQAAGPRAVSAQASSTAALPALPPLDDSYELKCAFPGRFGNWLIPDTVLLGRYPFIEPGRCRERGMGQEQLDGILRAGITTFVCLQAELPPQAEMTVGGLDGFMPYKPTAELIAAALSAPPSLEECGALRTPDLDKFLPPRRKAAGVPPRRRIDLDFLHEPIQDLSVPSEEQLERLLGELEGRLADGEKLYLHCWGGRGRAGTVGSCLLARAYGLSAEEALERVQRSFDTRRDDNRRSPETEEQLAFVRRFIGLRA